MYRCYRDKVLEVFHFNGQNSPNHNLCEGDRFGLCLRSLSLLNNRAELHKLSQQKVHESGYAYKKGKSRSKQFCTPETTPTKRPKLNAAMRNEQKSELDEDIKHTSQQLTIKEKKEKSV